MKAVRKIVLGFGLCILGIVGVASCGGGGGGSGVSTPQEINHKIDVFVKNEVNDAVLKDLSKNINSVNIDKVKEAMEKLNKEKKRC